MLLPIELRGVWLEMASRLRNMQSSQFWDGRDYDPIRDELAEMIWRLEPTDMEILMRVYDIAPELGSKPEWADHAAPDELLALLFAIISQERWVNGIAARPQANGLLSAALERTATADLQVVVRQ